MPVFSNDSLAEGIVQVSAIGTHVPVVYDAADGDIVLVSAGASGATVVLPTILGVLPAVTVSAQVPEGYYGATGASGASGACLPVSLPLDSLCVTVRCIEAAGGDVTIETLDGATILGATGALTLSAADTGYKLVSKSGDWLTV